MALKAPTWDNETISDFRRAFANLRNHPLWCGYEVAAGMLGYKSARGLKWAAGEYHSDNWPGSYRLAQQLREIYDGVFVWKPRRKIEVEGCPTCGGVHIAGDCHGKPIASVAILAPGEVVSPSGENAKRKPGKARKPRATVQMEPETRELLRSDKRPGESFDDVIRRWYDGDPYR